MARIGRPDIPWSVNKLARAVTKWTQAWDTNGKIDFINSSHKWLPAMLSCVLHSSALSTGFISRLRLFCDLKDSKSTSGRVLCIFGSRTFVPISWMCKKQTSVSHSSTESEIISLDAGLRMDGLPAVDLMDVAMEVIRSSNNTARQGRLAQGNLGWRGDHSVNKTKTKTSTEKSKRDVDQLSNVNYVPTNTHASQCKSQLCIFEDNEADEVQRWDTCPEPTELRLIGCSTASI